MDGSHPSQSRMGWSRSVDDAERHLGTYRLGEHRKVHGVTGRLGEPDGASRQMPGRETPDASDRARDGRPVQSTTPDVRVRRAKASSVSPVGLDVATRSVLFSFMGGVSFPGVVSAGGSLVANRAAPKDVEARKALHSVRARLN